MYKLNDTLTSLLSQANLKKSPTNSYIPKVYKKSFKRKVNFDTWSGRSFDYMGESFLSDIKKMVRGKRMVLSHLVHFRARGKPMYMAQEYIADKTGYSREYINRIIQELVREGYVDKYNRGRNKSNVYKICSDFLKKDNWVDLMLYIPAIRSLFLMLIMLQPVLNPYPNSFFSYRDYRHPQNNVTVLKNKDYNNINYSNTYTSNVVRKGHEMSMSHQEFPKKGSGIGYSSRPSSSEELKSKQVQLLRYQETKRIESNLHEQLKKKQAEAGTQKEKLNDDIARANLAKLWGSFK